MRYTRCPLCRWTCKRERSLDVGPDAEAQPRYVFTCMICKQAAAGDGAGVPLTFVVGHDGAILAVGEILPSNTSAKFATPRKQTAAQAPAPLTRSQLVGLTEVVASY